MSYSSPNPPSSDDLTRNIFQCCERQCIYQCQDAVIARLSADQLKPLISPDAIHHYEEHHRQVHDGYDIVDQVSYSDSSGGSKRKQGLEKIKTENSSHSVTHSTRELARYKDVTDLIPRYMPPSDQDVYIQIAVQQLGVGERFVKVMGQVSFEPKRKLGLLCLPSKASVQRFAESKRSILRSFLPSAPDRKFQIAQEYIRKLLAAERAGREKRRETKKVVSLSGSRFGRKSSGG